MIRPLFKKEMRHGLPILIGILLLLSLYNFIIIDMFDPVKSATLDAIMAKLGGMMEAFGMKPGAKGLLGHVAMYLYGFIMILFPVIFSIIFGNRLMGNYLDTGSMAYILSSPYKRRTVIINQLAVFFINLLIIFTYVGLVTIIFGGGRWDLDTPNFLKLLAGCFFLHLFIASFIMHLNVIFADSGKTIATVTGIILIMYLFQMGSNMGQRFGFLKYFTIFSLFNAPEISKGTPGSMTGPLILLAGSIIITIATVRIFSKKDYSL